MDAIHPWRSLRGRLFAFLLALAGLAALAVGGATYLGVRSETDALFDYHLQQMALSLRDQGEIGDDEREALAHPEFDYLVQVWSLQGVTLYTSRRPGAAPALPPRAVLGFSQLRIAGEDWRVFAAATALRVVQVAQPLAVRRRLATAAALRSVAPIALAAPVVALGLWWIIGWSLRPLQRVTQAAGARSADSLQALPGEGLPLELQPLVAAFNGLLQRLARAFEAQRGFVADAAHELRTPLTALKLQIGLLQGTPPGPALDAAVQRLRAGVDRAAHLVEQLLALARAEPGAAPAMAELDLAGLARLALADAQPLAQRLGATITLDAPAALPLQGDAQALRSALRNLLDNAVKHGGRQVQVLLQAQAGGWLLRVDDDGPGIAPAERARVTQRFQRGGERGAGGESGARGDSGEGSGEGSGLGLAIVQAVAQRHGAQLVLQGSPRGGLRAELRGPPV